MAGTVAETIQEITRNHLKNDKGLLFGQCVTAVGWIGGTVPQMTEEEGIVELSMADVAGPGICVGVALMGRRPIFVIRYQGFMWYNASPIVNYAAKSKAVWGVPCPIFVRSLAMEGGMGPVASAAHHSMVHRMPGLPISAPMTPGEYRKTWNWFMEHDDPIYVSEHRKSFPVNYEMPDSTKNNSKISIFGISASRLNAIEAVKQLEAEGFSCDLFHLMWIKPFDVTETMVKSLKTTGLGLVIDSDFEIGGTVRSIAYDLMHASGVPVHALGLEDRTAGFAPHFDNPTPTPEKIYTRIKELLKNKK